jgi:hypothetical protein
MKRNMLTQANLGRGRCDRTMVRNLGPKLTGNDIVTLLGHRPTRTQPQDLKSHSLQATDQGQQGRKTEGMMSKAAIED